MDESYSLMGATLKVMKDDYKEYKVEQAEKEANYTPMEAIRAYNNGRAFSLLIVLIAFLIALRRRY